MPLQLRIKMPGMQEGTVIALQLVEADWIPDCDTKLFEEFTREALELLSFQPEDELLLAPLREDFDAELVPFFDKAIDWRLLEAVRACRWPQPRKLGKICVAEGLFAFARDPHGKAAFAAS